MIDRGILVRQSTVAAISGSITGRLVGQFEHKAKPSVAKIQRSGRNGQGDVNDLRLSPLWLSASSSPPSWAVIITIDNAITYKAQRDKNARELKLANAAVQHADASA